MPTPSEVKPASEIFKDGSGGDNKVYVSPNHKLSTKVYSGTGVINNDSEASLNYAIVIDPVTKEQAVYQRDYNFFGQPEKLDPSKKLAVKGPDGTFVPTDYATGENFNENLLRRLQEDTAQATFENVVDYTVKNALKQTSKDGTFTPAQVAEAKGEEPETPIPPDNPENPGGGDGETEPVTGDGSLNGLTVSSAANQETVKSFAAGKSDLVYPEGAIGNESDYMKFTALKYLPGTLNTSGGSFGTSYQSGTPLGQSVQLPIQGGIQDSNAVGWNEDTMNVIQAAGAEIAEEFIGSGISAAVNTLLGQAKTLSSNSGPAKTAIRTAMAGQAVGSNVIGRTERAILNPNTELLFQGPQLRAFSFNFKLTPRSSTEAAIVKSIIKFFKFHMAPKTSDANLFLKAPNIFRIEFFKGGQQHSGINLIKDCALQACTVDYTPDGTYMRYDDGSMFSYDLQLQFMELVPIYAKDYNEGTNAEHPIGY
jgi:hypothetical protein